MKKLLALLLSLSVVLALTACGKTATIQSVEDLAKAANAAMVKPQNVEVTDEAFAMLDGDPQIAEYSFTVKGVPCKLRFAKVGIETDISGEVNGEGDPLMGSTDSDTLYVDNDDLNAKRWVTVDGQYVLIAYDAETWEWADFDAVCKEFANMEPLNWTSDVPFASYKALEGTYTDADYNMGSVVMKGDHVLVLAYLRDADGNTKAWEMEATLEGDKLVYDKEKISVTTYDEEAGESSTTDLPDGGAGFVTITDGVMNLSGCASAELQSLVLQKADY